MTQEIGTDTPRILISRMSAIGDTILTTPVACRLRERYPKAFISWVVEEKSSQFVVGHPALDEVLVFDRGWYVSAKGILSARRKLKKLNVDIAVDCQSTTKSAMACWLSGAKTRIGLKGRYGSELSPWFNNRFVEPRQPHIVDRSLELLGVIGIDHFVGDKIDTNLAWRLPIDHQADETMNAWLDSNQLEQYAIVNPGATWESKRWEMSRFGEIVSRLGQQRGLRTVIVWGGKKERQMAEEIRTAGSGWGILAPNTSLHELASLISGARIMVSGDTGPMHLAVAVGTPTVGLHGATHPLDCGPYGTPHAGVLKKLVEGNRRQRRSADNSAICEISVDDAWRACVGVLDRTAHNYPNPPVAMAS